MIPKDGAPKELIRLLQRELAQARANARHWRAEEHRFRTEAYRAAANGRWTPTLEKAANLKMNGSFVIDIDDKEARRLRAMLNGSKRTYLFKFTIRKILRYQIKKVGKW